MPSALRPLQLRSSGAHCVRKLAKSLAKSWQGGSEHGGEAKVVEEKEEDEEEVEEKEEEKKEKEKDNSDKI